MKKLILVSAVMAASFNLMAQVTEKTANHFEIETDPIAFSYGGVSGHAALRWKNERVQLGYAQLTIPEFMANNEDVTESFKSISLKWDYFFGQKDGSKGFFAGPTVDYMFLKYADPESNELKESQFNLGIRAGYRFGLFKKNKVLNGLYVTPWVGTSWLTKAKDYQLGGKTYSRKTFTLFPTVHLGWTF